MAGISNITTGSQTRLYWDSKKINAEPTSIKTEISNIQSIGDLSDTANQVSVNQYGSGYTMTLAGQKTLAPFDVVMNWVPTDTEHQALKKAYDDSAQVTFKMVYQYGSAETYVVFNASLTGYTISSPADGVRTATVNIAPMGGYKISHKA